MSLLTKVGSFTASTSTGNVSYNGVGFQPVVLFLLSDERPDTAYIGNVDRVFGVASGSATGNQRCLSTQVNGSTSPTSAQTTYQNAIWAPIQGSSGKATLSSFDSDGFTLNWSAAATAGSAPTVYYYAIGGSDLLNAKVGEFASTTSTGNQAVTDPGFTPTALLIFGGSLTALASNSLGSWSSFGAATGATQRWAVTTHSRDGSSMTSTANNKKHQRSDSIVLALTNTGAIDARADVVSFDTNGFTLNWVDAPATNGLLWTYVAIKGGQWLAGVSNKPTGAATANQDVTAGFPVTGLLLQSFGLAATTTISADDELSLGWSDGTTEATVWGENQDAQLPSVANRVQNGTKALRLATSTSTTDAECDSDFTSVSNGFRLAWTTNNATASEICYLAMGATAAAATTAYKDAAGRFRLRATAFKTAAARLRLRVQASRDAAARTRLAVRQYRDAAVRLRLRAAAYRTAAARFRLFVRGYRDSAARFRLRGLAYQPAAARFRLRVAATKDAATRVRLRVATARDRALRLRLARQGLQDAAARVRLQATAFRTVAARIRLALQGTREAAARFRVRATTVRAAAVRVRLALAGARDAALRLRLRVGTARDAAVRSRLAVAAQRTAAVRFRLQAAAATDAAVRVATAVGASLDHALRARLAAPAVGTAAARVQVALAAVRAAALRWRLRAPGLAAAATRFQVTSGDFRDAASRARVQAAGAITAALRVALAVLRSPTVAVRVRLRAGASRSTAARWLLQAAAQPAAAFRFRLAVPAGGLLPRLTGGGTGVVVPPATTPPTPTPASGGGAIGVGTDVFVRPYVRRRLPTLGRASGILPALTAHATGAVQAPPVPLLAPRPPVPPPVPVPVHGVGAAVLPTLEGTAGAAVRITAGTPAALAVLPGPITGQAQGGVRAVGPAAGRLPAHPHGALRAVGVGTVRPSLASLVEEAWLLDLLDELPALDDLTTLTAGDARAAALLDEAQLALAGHGGHARQMRRYTVPRGQGGSQ